MDNQQGGENETKHKMDEADESQAKNADNQPGKIRKGRGRPRISQKESISDPEEKLGKQERNRVAAKESRERKKIEAKKLKEEFEKLQQENTKLKEENGKLRQENTELRQKRKRTTNSTVYTMSTPPPTDNDGVLDKPDVPLSPSDSPLGSSTAAGTSSNDLEEPRTKRQKPNSSPASEDDVAPLPSYTTESSTPLPPQKVATTPDEEPPTTTGSDDQTVTADDPTTPLTDDQTTAEVEDEVPDEVITEDGQTTPGELATQQGGLGAKAKVDFERAKFAIQKQIKDDMATAKQNAWHTAKRSSVERAVRVLETHWTQQSTRQNTYQAQTETSLEDDLAEDAEVFLTAKRDASKAEIEQYSVKIGRVRTQLKAQYAQAIKEPLEAAKTSLAASWESWQME
eukprot:m.33348 g.33348  ORF g.33348 m.33348 type:complete len:399 (-) comp16804_c0_seq1:122-1318(-)